MRKPVAPQGKLPCGHAAYVYDLRKHRCMAVLGLTVDGYEVCGEQFSYVICWGERYPMAYWRTYVTPLDKLN